MTDIRDEWVEKADAAWLAAADGAVSWHDELRVIIAAVADDIRAQTLRDALSMAKTYQGQLFVYESDLRILLARVEEVGK